MQKYLKYIGFIGICLFSFYYTEKIALYVRNKNPIIQSLNEVSEELYVNAEDCELVSDIYIIPGLNGKEVNVNGSYNNMKDYNEFIEDKIIYNQVKPDNSLDSNKDRIIIRGNKLKNSVSLIFNDINDLTRYMNQMKYKVNVLIKNEEYDINYELINSSKNEKTYKNIYSYLSKNKINKKLCLVNVGRMEFIYFLFLVNDEIPSTCKDKYLFKSSLTINHSNFSTNINNIRSGEIILVENSLTLAELNILVNKIKSQGLNIVPLSNLISETN